MGAEPIISRRVGAAQAALAPLLRFVNDSPYAGRMGDATICDFTFGNPHEPTPPVFIEALRKHLGPLPAHAYAYTLSEPEARAAIAAELAADSGLTFEPEDILMTTGAFGALAVAFATLLDPGDEVVYGLPPWFCYEPMLRHLGAVPVKVPLEPPRFRLDAAAYERVLSPRTRVVIVNTPHNPTGRIYDAGELGALSAALERHERTTGRPIVLLSDEPYRALRFDGRAFEYPARHFSRTLMSYSWGKILLTPGARLGYLAISPTTPEREALREALATTVITAGWLYPNALLQRAVPDLIGASIDLDTLAAKRTRMVTALREFGYQLEEPEGTFYLFVRAPNGDDMGLFSWLAEREVFVLPGTVCEMPGYFRVCLTATEAMIERALPVFAAALHQDT